MATYTADKVLTLSPAAALGEDVVIDLAGPVNPSGWALAVYAGSAPGGPPLTLAGLAVAALGDGANTIRVTLPGAATATLPVAPGPKPYLDTLYLEVWRTDAGNRLPLRRLALPYFDPVRDPA